MLIETNALPGGLRGVVEQYFPPALYVQAGERIRQYAMQNGAEGPGTVINVREGTDENGSIVAVYFDNFDRPWITHDRLDTLLQHVGVLPSL